MTTVSIHPDIMTVRKRLADRRDVILDNADGPLSGIQLRRTKETHVQGADSYHPHTYIGWLYYGQPFMVDVPDGPKKKLTPAQAKRKEAFEAIGGIWLLPTEVNLAVPDGLGAEPPDIDKWLARDSNRVPLRLNER